LVTDALKTTPEDIAPEHNDRRNAASGMRTTRLSALAIEQSSEAGGEALRIAFEDVRKVRLSVEMAGPSSQVVCRVRDADGRELVFGSMSWVRPGAWELQAETFRALLIALHRALIPHRDRIAFLEGSTLGILVTLFSLGAAMVSITLIVFAYLFFWQENPVGLFFLPGTAAGIWMMRLFWPRKPRYYDPDRYALAGPPGPGTAAGPEAD
tara:strand:- start:32422 stop:33051 length:630 start_codon:yes stop_codon:yes gene_type:complete